MTVIGNDGDRIEIQIRTQEKNSGAKNLRDELVAEAKPFVDDAVRFLLKPLRTKRKPLPIHRQEKILVTV
jgi:hypothetical protein